MEGHQEEPNGQDEWVEVPRNIKLFGIIDLI